MSGILVVTGGSRGIGAATAILGAKRGFSVAVNYNNSPDRADQVVAEIQAAGVTAHAIQADVSTEAGATSLFEQVDSKLGTVTALLNNAGIIQKNALIADYTAAMINEQMTINVTSQFLCAREAVKRMSTDNGGSGGAIVNMSSAAARLGGGGSLLAYAASKGAIDTFTKGLAAETAKQGIRVNAVRPGLIETEIHDGTGDMDRINNLMAGVPMGRAGTALEVAEAVIWLLSHEARYVTDTNVDVTGGR
ncbi:MAG: NAD(P)-dependent dehydrogenase (short-subunit alcohol dehydrogenase family) [Hyphomicrobiaceae bacterium]|jgi:NAD(P)-dependent dehydrogenase (short-subunit alcohol dehydrogenase family)